MRKLMSKGGGDVGSFTSGTYIIYGVNTFN